MSSADQDFPALISSYASRAGEWLLSPFTALHNQTGGGSSVPSPLSQAVNDWEPQYYTPEAQRLRDYESASMRTHRCAARLTDFWHVWLHWYSPSEKWRRSQLLVKCYAAEPGQEPLDGYVVDPRTSIYHNIHRDDA